MDKLKKLNLIKDHFKAIGLTNQILKFGCYSDNIFTFNHKNVIHELEVSFILENDSILDEMTITDLLNLKTIKYFEFRSYSDSTMLSNGGKSITYNSMDFIN